MENTSSGSQYPSPAGDFDQRIESLVSNGYTFDLGAYISRGSEILKNNLGSFIGFILVMILFSIVLGLVPILGTIADWLISPALEAGAFIVAWRIVHNKPFTFGNFFDGFKFLIPLLVLNLVMIILLLTVIAAYMFIVAGTELDTLKELYFAYEEGDMHQAGAIAGFIFTFIWKLIPLFVILTYIATSWCLATYIVVFAKKGFWEAITISGKVVRKNFFSFLAFYIVLGFINLGGVICLVVGLLYTVPLTFCAMFAAYHSIVGTTADDIAEV